MNESILKIINCFIIFFVLINLNTYSCANEGPKLRYTSEADNNYNNYYLINCSNDVSVNTHKKEDNELHSLQIRFVLISKKQQFQNSFTQNTQSRFYEHEHSYFQELFRTDTCTPNIQRKVTAVDICKKYKDYKRGKKLVGYYFITILAEDKKKLKHFEKKYIMIGDKFTKISGVIPSQSLSNKKLEDFNFDFFVLKEKNKNDVKKIELFGPLFGNHSAYYSFKSKKHCEKLFKQYLDNDVSLKREKYSKNSIVRRNTLKIQNHVYPKKTMYNHLDEGVKSSVKKDEDTKKIEKVKRSGKPLKPTTIKNYYENFGIVNFNDNIDMKIYDEISKDSSKFKYTGILDKESWRINFSPVQVYSTKNIYFNNKTSKHRDKQIFFFFDEAMDLIGKYENINNSYTNLVSKRCMKIFQSSSINEIKSKKNDIITSMKNYKNFINSHFKDFTSGIEEAIKKFKNTPPRINTVGGENYAGHLNSKGNFILDEKFYLLQIGPCWVLKDYQSDKDTIPLILPRIKKIKIFDKFPTFWGEMIEYEGYKFHNSNQYKIKIFGSKILNELNGSVSSSNRNNIRKTLKNKIKLKPINLWIVFDTYNNNDILNNYRKTQTEFNKLLNKDIAGRFSSLKGSLLKVIKENDPNKFGSTSSSADFIKALTEYKEAIKDQSKLWEMHVLINTSPEGSKFNRIRKKQIAVMAKNFKELNIIRLHFWEFANSPESSSFYKGLAIRLKRDHHINTRHDFISSSKDFNKPFKYSKINFKLKEDI